MRLSPKDHRELNRMSLALIKFTAKRNILRLNQILFDEILIEAKA